LITIVSSEYLALKSGFPKIIRIFYPSSFFFKITKNLTNSEAHKVDSAERHLDGIVQELVNRTEI